MLTVEEIKKIFGVVDVEGFTADNLGLNNIYGSCFGWGLINGYGNDVEGFSKWKNIYYPLFLQRVIEGINIESNDFTIATNKYNISVLDWEYEILLELKISGQAKEQAILYILEQL